MEAVRGEFTIICIKGFIYILYIHNYSKKGNRDCNTLHY